MLGDKASLLRDECHHQCSTLSADENAQHPGFWKRFGAALYVWTVIDGNDRFPREPFLLGMRGIRTSARCFSTTESLLAQLGTEEEERGCLGSGGNGVVFVRIERMIITK